MNLKEAITDDLVITQEALFGVEAVATGTQIETAKGQGSTQQRKMENDNERF